MKKNVGTIDKIVRIIIAIVIVALSILSRSWWGLVAIIPLSTALIGFCPIYTIMDINTRKTPY